MALDRKKIALIHVAKKQIGLTEDDYRAILSQYGRAGSAADLSPEGFKRVMARLEGLGFKSTSTARPLPDRAGMASAEQTSLMRHLWHEFTNGQGTDATFGKWLEGRFKLSSIRFINARTAPKVIAALRAMVKRRAGKAA